VSTADWIVLGVVVLSALYGLTSGLVRGALALAGFALGAYVGARVAPALLSDGSPYAPLVALAGAVIGGTILRGLAGILGGVLRTTLAAVPGLRTLDSIAGLLLGAAAGVVLCWAVGAVLLYLPGQADLRREVQRSAILSEINDVFPPERLLETLEGVDPLGVLIGPPATVPPPDSRLVRDPDVVAASTSVVRVTGVACGLGVEGSGWIVRPGLVVTNAHVVAGQEDTRVLVRGREPGLDAVAVSFDARNDLAVLRVEDLDAPALTLARNPRSGTSAAILGFPGNGPYDVRAGRVGQTREVITQDAYGQGPVRRTITSLRGAVRSGNSGGPMVDADGEVVTTVFAATTSGPRGGFGVPNSIVRAALDRAAASNGVSTGRCTG
jgi:S1-C subfamily serine protease